MIVVIDCNNIAFKSAHTVGMLEYNGIPTGVIYGFFNQLFTIARSAYQNKPKTDSTEPIFVFTWDSRHSIRKQKYPFYKDKRKQNNDPEEMDKIFQQVNQLRDEILPQLGFYNNFVVEGYEADDIIARICQVYTDETIDIITGDDDLLQLLTNNVRIYNPIKGLYTNKQFIEQYGIVPWDWVKVKKIAGCKSDNVPGVPGVGESTAIKYLKYQIKQNSKTYQKIKDNQEIIKRNGWLVRLPLPGTPEIELVTNQFDIEEFKTICKQYGFNKWLNNPAWLDDLQTYLGVD